MFLEIDNRQEHIIKIEDEWVTLWQKIAEEFLRGESLPLNTEISLLLVDDQEIREINNEFREKDSVTDVLSFPIYSFKENDFPQENEDVLLGDIIISLETAKKQAKDFEHSFTRELMYLFVHGLYHLVGYDHEDEKDKVLMRKKEESLLSKFGVNQS